MINEFKHEYAFLSNFYYSSVVYDGICYGTVEHAYQAQKTTDWIKKKAIQSAPTPAEAKRIGQKVTLPSNWEQIKVPIMKALILDKFLNNKDLQEKLLNTEIKYLTEGNYWHDNFWGDCGCKSCRSIPGLNNLGEILMQTRSFISGKHMFSMNNGEITCRICGQIYKDSIYECFGKKLSSEEIKGYSKEGLVYKNRRWFKPIQVVHNKKSRYHVLIDRTTKWGNKFELKDPKDDEQREKVVFEYANWIINQPELINSLPELEGKILGCWGDPKLCHGHVLQYLIDGIGPFADLLKKKNG